MITDAFKAYRCGVCNEVAYPSGISGPGLCCCGTQCALQIDPSRSWIEVDGKRVSWNGLACPWCFQPVCLETEVDVLVSHIDPGVRALCVASGKTVLEIRAVVDGRSVSV